MATHCVLPIEETVDAGADGDSIRQRPRARRTNSSGDGSSQYAHSHQFSSGDGVAAHAAMISDHPGRQHRQSSESYANRTHTESPVDQPDEVSITRFSNRPVTMIK